MPLLLPTEPEVPAGAVKTGKEVKGIQAGRNEIKPLLTDDTTVCIGIYTPSSRTNSVSARPRDTN